MNAYYIIFYCILTEYVETHPEMKKKVQKNIAKVVYLPKTSSVNDLSTLN